MVELGSVEEVAWDLCVSSERRELVFVLPQTPELVCIGEVRSTGVVPSKLSSREVFPQFTGSLWVLLETASVCLSNLLV